MFVFETVLGLLIGAAIVSVAARKAYIPYPAVLALGGAVLAFLPGVPRLQLPPDLILALFVAPILLDAAYDASLRDLKRNWRPVSSLVFVAVGLTTVVVAVVARHFFPDLPWPAAVALGALVAPPDAVAAIAVLRQAKPPHRIRTVLEGESLLNDASALLIYKLAVSAVAGDGFSLAGAVPAFGLVLVGSIVAGWLVAWPIGFLVHRIDDAPASVVFQFVMTFTVWLAAQHIGLSAVVTVVVFGLTSARQSAFGMPAHLRVPSFAIWESATFVLNVLAFTLIGLQIGPILDALSPVERLDYIRSSLVILAAVIAVRMVWVMSSVAMRPGDPRRAPNGSPPPLSVKAGFVIGWSGMRGIVTLAAALALPAEFPHREFILLTAFVVVLGTLLIQGLTLRPLVRLLGLPADNTVEVEVTIARRAALKAAMSALDGDDTPAAQRLRSQYREALHHTKAGNDPHGAPDYELRRQIVPASRRSIDELRQRGTIGDEAYRVVEQELDWLELSSRSRDDGP